MPSGTHDEFLELCAISTSGQLSRDDQRRLDEHLAVCPDCREALRQYESIIDETIPAIGAEQLSTIDPGPGWSQSQAETAFFERLARQKKRQSLRTKRNENNAKRIGRVPPAAPQSTSRHLWMSYAAGVAILMALAFYTYRVGVRRGTDVASATRPATVPDKAATNEASLEEQLSDAAHDYQIARQQIAARDKALAELERQLKQQSAEIAHMNKMRSELESVLRTDQSGKQDLIQQQTEVIRRLESVQSESEAARHRLDSVSQQSTEEAAHAKVLETKVNDLTRVLQEREASLSRQQELLAHDRDIRELMGARDLYIAEVYDVAGDGATRKAYGRVFYTKGRSLIFYAYDLDQQETTRAQAFQAWGRRGPDWKRSLNLGIFYEDNVSKKRWVLKLDDPKTLADIEAVFVTLEPQGGSDKPSGKPILFASLKINPNHP